MRLTLLVALVLVTCIGALGADGSVLPVVPGTPDDLSLLAVETVRFGAFFAHVRSRNPAIDEIYLRTLHRYYLEICRLEEINVLSALAQMIHETDYLRFSGSVRAIQYNYAGLGAISTGHPGETFPSMRVGVTAHVQHLKAYASSGALATDLVDPRFHLVVRGSARTVRSLTGRWATDPDYGSKVLAHVGALRHYTTALSE